jgi:hypothetical protein
MRDSGWVEMAGSARERCDGGRTGMESGWRWDGLAGASSGRGERERE